MGLVQFTVIMRRYNKIYRIAVAVFRSFAEKDAHFEFAIFRIAIHAIFHWATAAFNPETTHQASKAVVECGRDEKL
jgi:hypothetical protein